MTHPVQPRGTVLALAFFCAAACDGIGSPVVDHVPPPPEMGSMTLPLCAGIPECDRPIGELELEVTVVTDLPTNTLTPCSASAATVLDDPSGLIGRALGCGDMTLLLPDEDGECSFRAEGVSLDHTLLRVSSARPCVLELPGAIVRDSRIELTGPVTLVLGERAELERTGVLGARTESGAPLLDIELAEVARSAIGGRRSPFAGMVSVRQTMVTSSSMRAEDVALESVVFLHALLRIENLDAADATFAGVRLEVGDAVLAGCSLDRVDVPSCRALLIAGSEIYKSMLSGCDDDFMRLYNTTIGRTVLDGFIELDESNVEGVQLGIRGPTELVQFGGVINKVAFCEQGDSYRLGELANASCVRCTTPGALELGGACNVSEVDRIIPEECAVLSELAECDGEDVPTHRPRPPARLP